MFLYVFTKHKPHASRQNHPRQRQNSAVCCCVTSFTASAFHSVAAGGDGRAEHVFLPGDLDL